MIKMISWRLRVPLSLQALDNHARTMTPRLSFENKTKTTDNLSKGVCLLDVLSLNRLLNPTSSRGSPGHL